METTKVIILKNCSRDGIKYKKKRVYELSVDVADILKSEGYAIEAEDYFGIESVQGVEEKFRQIDSAMEAIPNTYATKQELEDLVLEGGNLVIRDIEDGEIFEIDTDIPIVNVTSVTLNKSTITMNPSTTDILTVTILPANATNKNVTWSTSNASVATVANGVVSGVADGFCAVTVTTVDGSKSATCSVTVQTASIPVTSVALDKTTHTFKVDETVQLNATVLPSNATNKTITWSSSDSNIATVVNGLVTAKAEGSATITATTQDGNFASSCALTIQSNIVIPPPSEELNPSITSGLTHMYDFTKLTTASTFSEDLIGTMDITVASEFAGDGYLLYKNKHMNCGNLLENDFTTFLTVKYSKGSYTFYCGDKSITASGTKFGTISQVFNKFTLKDNQYYSLCVKFDSTNKIMSAFIDGVLISTHENTATITDKSIYTSFLSNGGEGKNYYLLVYNRQLTDQEILITSNEISKKLNTDNVSSINNKNGLKEYYNFNNTQGNETEFLSLVGDNTLKVTGTITGNSGLVLGTSTQNLTSGFKVPFNRYCTYFIKFTPPSTSTKGNKIIEFNNISLNISKTSCTLKTGSTTTTAFTPTQDSKNVVAFVIDVMSEQAKIYHNGTFKQSQIFNDISYSYDSLMYMLANDLIIHDMAMYDRVLSDAEINEVSSELMGV